MGHSEGTPSLWTQKDRPTVTCVADNGLGDRLGTLFDAVWLAYVLDARFHMLWNANNECRARFAMLFSFDGTHVSVPDNGSSGLELRRWYDPLPLPTSRAAIKKPRAMEWERDKT